MTFKYSAWKLHVHVYCNLCFKWVGISSCCYSNLFLKKYIFIIVRNQDYFKHLYKSMCIFFLIKIKALSISYYLFSFYSMKANGNTRVPLFFKDYHTQCLISHPDCFIFNYIYIYPTFKTKLESFIREISPKTQFYFELMICFLVPI